MYLLAVSLLIILLAIVAYTYNNLKEGFDEIVEDTTIPVPAAVAPAPVPAAAASAPAPAETQESAIAKSKQDNAELLRDIREVVHNELLRVQKMTTANAQPHLMTAAKPDGSSLYYETPAIAQGQEHSTRPTWCPRDMSEYIRKDSIPCWGCKI